VVSALATLGSVVIAAIAGQFFDGTPYILIISVIILASFGLYSAHQLKQCDRIK
jgi:DHA1 family bicyclomycin/chloramphenicol resistance-like MFS transporter